MNDPPALPLEGRAAIVTGAASGVGAAIALSLARAGADLVLAGRSLGTLDAVAAAARAAGRSATTIACDVTQTAQVARLVEQARAAFGGGFDILVNAAGGTGGISTAVWETSPEDFASLVAVNLTGCFLTMRAVLPIMIARRSGRIVNVGGTFGLRGRAGRGAYSAAKWGLRGLTKTAAIEAGPHGITVNCVCPGPIEASNAEGGMAGVQQELGAEYPLRRASTPQDVADAVVFLAGDGARQITGQDLAVDGGWTM